MFQLQALLGWTLFLVLQSAVPNVDDLSLLEDGWREGGCDIIQPVKWEGIALEILLESCLTNKILSHTEGLEDLLDNKLKPFQLVDNPCRCEKSPCYAQS